MRKFVTTFAAVTAMAAGAAVLQLKMTVQEKNEEIRVIAQQIRDDREAIRILEAEWAYLTTPRTLQDRSVEFLALMPPRAKQVLHDPVVIPFRPHGVDVDHKDVGTIILPAAENVPLKKALKKTRQAEGESL